MADNKDNSRADLFAILNELHNDNTEDKTDASSPVAEEKSGFETQGRVEELIKILSADDLRHLKGDAEPEQTEQAVDESLAEPKALPQEGQVQEGENPQEGEEIEVPAALFSHLSGEADSVPESGEVNSHFSDEVEPSLLLPEEGEEYEEEEEDDEDEDEEEEPDTMVKKVGKFFRGMSFLPKAIIYILLVVMASAYLSYYIITIGNDVFALVTDSQEITIVIEEGADNDSVAKLLEEKGVIKYGWVYKLYMDYRADGDSDDGYIVGEHVLNQNFNYSQIITALTSKSVEREIKRITIPEGFTVEQIITLLVDNGIGERSDYIDVINNYPYKWDFVRELDAMLATRDNPKDRIYRLEGYLYPDTYEFSTTEDEIYVINKMLNAFNDKFWREFIETDSDGNSIQKQMLEEYNMTFDDVIVMASMLQSEGGTAEDFYYISYVFHNRLKHPAETNGKLESDATIQYVLPQRVEAEVVDVTYDTPYNTYTYKGLPPGAISNPGSDALSAVLYPEAPKNENDREIDAFYFVANKAGKTYYARNKEGHEANRRRVERDNEAIEAGNYEG